MGFRKYHVGRHREIVDISDICNWLLITLFLAASIVLSAFTLLPE